MSEENNSVLEEVVIRFAGDSGDGIQLTGSQFTNSTALSGYDLGTLPDFPAEIRAPAGTVPGVSGFQIKFGGNPVYTPGDKCDVLVIMNAAAFKSNLTHLKKGGLIIANNDGFDSKNLRLAGYDKDEEPLKDNLILDGYKLYTIQVTKLTREALKEMQMGTKEKDRSKNMFVLGLLYWLYGREIEPTIDFITNKFGKESTTAQANILALKAGYNYGETAEIYESPVKVKPAQLRSGTYRGITGNIATAYGLISASVKSGLQLF